MKMKVKARFCNILEEFLRQIV